MPVTYEKDMRDRAKAEGRKLLTISTPAMTLQTPASSQECRAASRFMTAILKNRHTGPEEPPELQSVINLQDALARLLECMEAALSNPSVPVGTDETKAAVVEARRVLALPV